MTLHPQTSNQLQSLKKTVFCPFKKFYSFCDFVCSAAPPSTSNNRLCSEHHESAFPRNLVHEHVQIDSAVQVHKQTKNVSDVTLATTPDKRNAIFFVKKICFSAKHIWPSESSCKKIWQKSKEKKFMILPSTPEKKRLLTERLLKNMLERSTS